MVSASTFAVGAVIPLIIAVLVPAAQITLIVAATTLIALSVLGGLGASVGGAGVIEGAVCVTFWSALPRPRPQPWVWFSRCSVIELQEIRRVGGWCWVVSADEGGLTLKHACLHHMLRLMLRAV